MSNNLKINRCKVTIIIAFGARRLECNRVKPKKPKLNPLFGWIFAQRFHENFSIPFRANSYAESSWIYSKLQYTQRTNDHDSFSTAYWQLMTIIIIGRHCRMNWSGYFSEKSLLDLFPSAAMPIGAWVVSSAGSMSTVSKGKLSEKKEKKVCLIPSSLALISCWKIHDDIKRQELSSWRKSSR